MNGAIFSKGMLRQALILTSGNFAQKIAVGKQG